MISRNLALPTLSLFALLSFGHLAHAQTTETTEPSPAKSTSVKGVDCFTLTNHTAFVSCYEANSITKTFFLANTSAPNDANEILVAVRNMADPQIKIYLLASQNAVVIHDYPQDLARLEALIRELDRPHKLYRLTYTIATVEAGKTIGTQHYSLIGADGQRTTLKEGDKVPVATGSYSTENATAQTQFTYLDVGMSFDATVNSVAGGVALKSKVEQSSLGPSTTIAGVNEPVVRQSVLDGSSIAQLGKPLMLGSIDIPNSTRHLDIDVMVESIK